jgi:hypothetical protein
VQVRGLPTHDRPGYLGSASIRIVAPAPAGFTVIDGRFCRTDRARQAAHHLNRMYS